MAVFPREDGGPGRTADGIATERILKNGAAGRKAVDVRSGSDLGQVPAIG